MTGIAGRVFYVVFGLFLFYVNLGPGSASLYANPEQALRGKLDELVMGALAVWFIYVGVRRKPKAKKQTPEATP